MRIAILADQHGELPEIPSCDLMILSGDLCGGPEYINGKWCPNLSDGFWAEWLCGTFTEWVRGAPYTIVVGGNHDTTMESIGIPNGLTILLDSGCEYAGLRFWGAP